MLSISKPIKGAKQGKYYLDLTKEDYYANSIEQTGQWFGRGAELLRLGGNVEAKPYLNLLSGFSPDGRRKLVQNTQDPDRASGWDLTFSAPKSVSVLWALAPDPIRQQVELAHQRAVETALTYIEQTASLTRRGKGGKHHEAVEVIFARFQHSTSRAHDPQLHTHALIFNLGLRKDGTAGALHSRYFFQSKMKAGAVYQTELAAILHNELGLAIDPDEVAFHIRGIPKELCREFSKRRVAIERHLHDHRQSGAIAAKEAALQTRPHKANKSYTELFKGWREAGKAMGWGPEQVLNLIHQSHQQQHSAAVFSKAIDQALASVPRAERNPKKLIAVARKVAMEHGIDSRGLKKSLDRYLSSQKNSLIRLEWKRVFDKTPWIPPRGKFLHVERKPLFPDAPWKFARGLYLPVVVAALPRIAFGEPKDFPRRWSWICWKRDLVLSELRIQRRVLFRKAPGLSPLHGLSIRSFRLTSHKSKWESEVYQRKTLAGHSY